MLLLLVGLASFVPPLAADEADDGAKPPGRWRRHRVTASDAHLTDTQREAMRQLGAVGYLSGSTAGPAGAGVTIHDPRRTSPGLNLVTSGHAPEAALVDADGRVLHRWRLSFSDALGLPGQPGPELGQFWRRVHCYENGDLLAIFDGEALIKIDAASRLLWTNRNGAHHDLDVLENGDIYVLTREPVLIDWVNPDSPVLEDYVSVLSPDGTERKRVSILESLRNSEHGSIWVEHGRLDGDILHTNSLEVLDGRIADRVPGFERGNVLTSFRFADAIAVVDLAAEAIVWLHRGSFQRQHDPTVLPGGNLLLFDNNAKHAPSSVIELDPATGNEVWVYRGTEESPFQTNTCGTSQRLDNGNTLITESDNGRAFEVAPDGTIVWEYVNPHRAGPDGEFIATLFEIRRLPPDFPTDWIPAPPEPVTR